MQDIAMLVLALKYELRRLNEVVAKRKAATRDLRDRLLTLQRLHGRPETGDLRCAECLKPWPCPSYLVTNPGISRAVTEGLLTLKKVDE